MKIFAHINWLFATIIIFVSLTLMILIYKLLPRPYGPKSSAWLIRTLIFFSVDVKGQEDPHANMFLLNHQSDLDIAIMETVTTRDLAWVAKKELFKVPFFGLALSFPENIGVARESKSALIKLVRDAKVRLEKGRAITIFPEGTRSTTGKMLPFKGGAKVIADTYALKVQPVLIMQSAKYYNIKQLYYKPGRITVIFLDSFNADPNDDEWLNRLQQTMQREYDNELRNNPSHR